MAGLHGPLSEHWVPDPLRDAWARGYFEGAESGERRAQLRVREVLDEKRQLLDRGRELSRRIVEAVEPLKAIDVPEAAEAARELDALARRVAQLDSLGSDVLV